MRQLRLMDQILVALDARFLGPVAYWRHHRAMHGSGRGSLSHAGGLQICVAALATHVWDGGPSPDFDLLSIILIAKEVTPEILDTMVSLCQEECDKIAGIGQVAVVASNNGVFFVDSMRGGEPLVVGRFHLVAVGAELRRRGHQHGRRRQNDSKHPQRGQAHSKDRAASAAFRLGRSFSNHELVK